ncbi:hypothetical protein Tsubulata_014957 [Turnera subulata]|uniref:MBD domain-containing protein n=1 Tax=Turnera subulata TaxID=218843 RepID=A0A9Q0F9H1_9ROSI|nr:hypothetical protein Tsubulata_014957 [Turnera subulata]
MEPTPAVPNNINSPAAENPLLPCASLSESTEDDGRVTGDSTTKWKSPTPKPTMSSATPPPRFRRNISDETVSWLPTGWVVEDRARTIGPHIDRYYFDPTMGRRFRSKKEVLTYLESGILPKRPKRKAAPARLDGENS